MLYGSVAGNPCKCGWYDHPSSHDMKGRFVPVYCRHSSHCLDPCGDRSIDVKSKQIKGEKKAIKLPETFEYKPEKYAESIEYSVKDKSDREQFKWLPVLLSCI